MIMFLGFVCLFEFIWIFGSIVMIVGLSNKDSYEQIDKIASTFEEGDDGQSKIVAIAVICVLWLPIVIYTGFEKIKNLFTRK